MKRLLMLLSLCLCTTNILAENFPTFLKKRFTSPDGTVLNYRIQYPIDYDSSKTYPLLLFLHGAGERGEDNCAQLIHGGKLFSSWECRTQFPAIIIAPQCPKDKQWAPYQKPSPAEGRIFPVSSAPTKQGKAVKELLDRYIKKGIVDTKRIYISGLSMGGMGTFDLVLRHPHIFAAASPICGGTNTERIAKFKGKTAFRIYHGAADSVVSVELSRQATKALQAVGCTVEYIEYPGVDHNSWDNAFAEPDFIKWMFEK